MSECRIGVVGTGFISRHFCLSVKVHPGYRVSSVLTRRGDCSEHPEAALVTRDPEKFLSSCDLVLECSGDPIHASNVVAQALDGKQPVVTMNAEFQITAGSYFVGKGLLTEAEGDQPGVLAALHREALELGFTPLAYGNMKGFLNPDPTPEEMEYWAKRQGISVPMVTSFTDGTKVQVEQVLVGNGLGATIAQEGLLGPALDNLDEASQLFTRHARALGKPITDYVLSGKLSHGVFLVASHQPEQREALKYLKLGDGPHYTLIRPNIFVHLEIMKSVKRLWQERSVTLDNSARPRLSVAAIAKKDLPAGTRIDKAVGSFAFRGMAVEIARHPQHVPIGLVQQAVLARPVERGQILQFQEVELPASLAVEAWRHTAALAGPLHEL